MYLLSPEEAKHCDRDRIGGKAYNLAFFDLKQTPQWFVIPADFFETYDEQKGQALKEELRAKLNPRKLYAVRSSASLEDSTEHSFAGMLDSFLNVPLGEILLKARQVYAGVGNERVKDYIKINDLNARAVRCACVVMEMVEPDYAGVLNTVNPITNNPDELYFSVVPCLGEALVSGQTDSTDYVIAGGKVTVNGEVRLPKKVVTGLVVMANTLKQKSDRFLDVEFCVRKGKIYFLQARAIATYARYDTTKRNLLIDNANIIESYFGVVSPLTYSFASDIYTKVYTAALKTGKVSDRVLRELEPSLRQMLYCYEGRVYYNMNSWYHVNSIFPWKSATAYMENMMGVRTGADKVRRVRLGLWETLRFGGIFLSKLWHIDALSERFLQSFARVIAPYYGRRLTGTNEELIGLYRTIESEILNDFTTPIINDCGAMFFYGAFTKKVQKNRKITDKNAFIAATVNNGGDVYSAQSIPLFLEIIEKIRQDEGILRDFLREDKDFLREKYAKNSSISSAIEGYIREFGCRVVDELKLETVTLIEDPTPLFADLQEYLKGGFTRSQPACSDEAAVPLGMRFLAKKSRYFIRNRERLRLRRTYIFSVVRNIFLALGDNFAREGRIETQRDIFYLTKEEIFSVFPLPGMRELVAKRKEECARDRNKPSFHRVVFYGDEALPVLYKHGGRGDLHGVPSGAGRVIDEVVVTDVPDAELVANKIVCTRRTDPGWISVFPLIKGLIVEHGSVLSHSAVVARELKIPAIFSVDGASALLKNGDVVELDGINGVVYVRDEKVL